MGDVCEMAMNKTERVLQQIAELRASDDPRARLLLKAMDEAIRRTVHSIWAKGPEHE